MNGDLLMGRHAVISSDGLYRYNLGRVWNEMKRSMACFVMLNPSTADAEVDDPTIRKCVGFAQRWGNGEIIVVNLFAFRATKPEDMMAAADPYGPENDDWIERAVRYSEKIICAWGNHGVYRRRDKTVLNAIIGMGKTPLALRVNAKTGQPAHPLYVPYEMQPMEYRP